jgi:hypothetical protein
MQKEKALNDLFEILVERAYPAEADDPEMHQLVSRLGNIYQALAGMDRELLWDAVQQTRQARAF